MVTENLTRALSLKPTGHDHPYFAGRLVGRGLLGLLLEHPAKQ
jgi:hypothetical protein